MNSIPFPAAPAAVCVVRLLLAATFALAGAAKLRDSEGTAAMLRAFGVPAKSAPVFAVALWVADLAVAAALLPSFSSQWAGAAGAFLLAVFTAVIAVNLALGKRPECRCFGAMSTAPINSWTVARNMLLLAMAVLAASRPAGPEYSTIAAWLSENTLAAILGATAFGFAASQTFLTFQIIRQEGRILLRLEELSGIGKKAPAQSAPASRAGLPIGTPAPTFQLQSLAGDTVTQANLLKSGRSLLLLFVHPSCGPCNALLPDAIQWQTDAANRLLVALVSEGKAEENRKIFSAHPPGSVFLQKGHEVSDAFRAYGTPNAVLVDPSGRVASYVAGGADAIKKLVASMQARPRHAVNMQGLPAPLFTAKTNRGELLELTSFRGEEVLVLFWNPNCGFCRAAAHDLSAWDRAKDRPALVLISPGADPALDALGFRSPVLLDDTGGISRSFNISGTPMAVLVSSDGVIASAPIAGKDAILAFLHEWRKPSVHVRSSIGEYLRFQNHATGQ
jgi:thiol-disulfide isomerase/thioredoxin/uncharacterized membrane protein YphA (DoxX/SURF4 family)